MLTLLTNAFIRYLEDRRHRAMMRHLLTKDDKLLEDMGLDRGSVIEAMGQPFGADLKEYAHKRSYAGFMLDRRL